MLNQIVIVSGYILGIFLVLRYVFRIKFAIGKNVDQSEYQNQKIDVKNFSDFLEAEKKKIESESSYRRQEICAEFSDCISPLLGKYFDLNKITADMERIKKKMLSEREPLLFHHEAWEMFQMMGITARLQNLLQEASKTRSKKKKAELIDEFYSLKESLKEYKLPYAYGELGEYEYFLATCDDAPETEREEEDWQETEEDTASTNTNSADIDPTGQIERMFAEVKANSLIANPS
jgi:hypothetical protein